MNYYQHHIGDYRRDTSHLSLLEHGIYRQLLDQYYLSETPITLDDAKLMRSLCVRSTDEMQALKNVLADFFDRTEDGYMHGRCNREIGDFKDKSERASASAKTRWSRKNTSVDATALRPQCEGTANHKPITNNHKPITNKKHKSISSEIDLSDVPEQVLKDWSKLRKERRAPITKTAVNGIRSQALELGIDLADALVISCNHGWTGFRAAWVRDKINSMSWSPHQTEKEKVSDWLKNLTGGK